MSARFRRNPEHLDRFKPAVQAFGRLPRQARLELMQRLNIAIASAWTANKFTLAPSAHARRLSDIATRAGALLEALEDEDTGVALTWAGPLHLACAKRQVSLSELMNDLRRLVEAAEQIERAEKTRKKSGRTRRGDVRRAGPGPSEVLLHSLFDIYADARRRFPKSGPAMGFSFGGPLCRFVSAVYAAFETVPPTDSAVKTACDRWRKSMSVSTL
jgi:uncharacterized protein YukE